MTVVSTGLALPCPVALGTMLCSLAARVSAFPPSDTEWKKLLKQFTSAREKDPDQMKTSFHWFRQWHVAKLATGHCLKQRWPSCWLWFTSCGHNKLVMQLQLEMPLIYLTNKPNIFVWWSYPVCFSPKCLITRIVNDVGEQWEQGDISYVISLLTDVIVSWCFIWV